MDIEGLRVFFGWCAIVNIGILIWWFLAVLLMRDFVFNVHKKIFNVPADAMPTIHYCGLGIYKLTTFTFFVVPYLVLRFAF